MSPDFIEDKSTLVQVMWLGVMRQQANTWTPCHFVTLLGHNELMDVMGYTMYMYCKNFTCVH